MDAPQQLVMKPLPQTRSGVPEPAPIWLQRLSVVVLVLFCFYIGGVLAILPWWPYYWDHNSWLLAHPSLYALLIHGWIRGIVSGIGFIDIWIGISELLHYRDHHS
jgi:succinate dehydrogenase hydrophobic anchor subunit